MSGYLYVDEDEDGSGFCDCGVTIGQGETECAVCAAAPHHRECPCDECDTYWSEIKRRSLAAYRERELAEPADSNWWKRR